MINNLRLWIEALAWIAQIFSFPVAAWAIVAARRESRAGRDMEIALNLADSFRSRWEGGWREELNELKSDFNPGGGGFH